MNQDRINHVLFELQKLASRKADLVLAIAEETSRIEANSHRFTVDRTYLHKKKREFEDLCGQVKSMETELGELLGTATTV